MTTTDLLTADELADIRIALHYLRDKYKADARYADNYPVKEVYESDVARITALINKLFGIYASDELEG